MTLVLFLLSIALLVLFGLPAAFHPESRTWSLAARAGASFALGTISIAVSAIVVDFVGLPGNALTLSVLPLAASAALTHRALRAGHGAGRFPMEPAARVRPIAIAISLAGIVLALAAVVSGRANSTDFLYFWGIKAARYVAASGFDPQFLRWPNAIHTHVNYPPLYTVSLAWNALWGGGAALWRHGPMMSIVGVAATAPVVHALLRYRLRATGAVAVTAFWTVAISTAVTASYSAGNAEAMLLMYATIAATAILVDVAPLRVVAAVALSGLVLTKLEGIIAAALFLGGVMLRDLTLHRERPWRNAAAIATAPGVALALWYAYMLAYRIPLTDPTREPLGRVTFEYVGVIVTEQLRHLAAGTWGLAWLFPLAAALVAWRKASRAHLPGLLFAASLLGFYFVYYLHANGDPSELIGWTLPRTSLPALSVWIVTAGLISASPAPRPTADVSSVTPAGPKGAIISRTVPTIDDKQVSTSGGSMSRRALITLALVTFAATLPLFAADEVPLSMDAAVYNPPPSMLPRVATTGDLVLAAPRLLEEHKHRVGPLSMVEQAALHADTDGSGEKGFMTIGVQRGMPQDVRFARTPSDLANNSLRSHAGGLLEKALDGSMTWTTSISSEGAGAIRLNLRASGFPADARAYVYSGTGEVHGPYELAALPAEGFWSNTVFSDEVFLEVQLGKADVRDAQLTISEIAHIEHPNFAPRAGTIRPIERNEDSCFVDASCVSSGEWSNAANASKAIGAYAFNTSSGSVGLCTGGLLIDSVQSFKPYFLTANHCFTTQTSANTMEVFWRFQSTTCNGSADPSKSPRTSGGTLLATSTTSDFTLVQLKANPPSGSYYLGWQATTNYASTAGVKTYRLHHPYGEKMHYARHETTGNTAAQCGIQTPGHFFSFDRFGGTAGGSSGSPVMLPDLKVIGQLRGGCGPDVQNNCDRRNYNVDGAFRTTYNSIQQWLAPGGGGSGPCTATSSSFCTLSKRFEVKLAAKDPRSGKTDAGHVMFSSDFFGYFGFPVLAGNTTDPQVFIKVLDGRPVNGKFWVFYAALTDVEFTITVRDTTTGATKTYYQKPYTQTSANDTSAF